MGNRWKSGTDPPLYLGTNPAMSHCQVLSLSLSETFEKCSISFKIKAREDFNQRNILNISRIKI